MQVQCVRYLYRLTWLHSCHMSQRSPSCSVYLPFPLRRHITVHILCIPDLFLCRFPEFHMPCCHFLRSPVWKIKQYPEVLLPCSKYSRQQLLLLHILHPGLRREPRYLAVSMVLLSMPGNTHLLPSPWNERWQNALWLFYSPVKPLLSIKGYHSVGSTERSWSLCKAGLCSRSGSVPTTQTR